MKKLLYILATVILLTSCYKIEFTTPEFVPETTPQTTLMYMTGTDLSYYFRQNIAAAKKAVAKNALGYGRFLIFKHSSSSAGDLLELKYQKGACVVDTLKSYKNVKSLSEECIAQIIGDAKQLAPADSYNLIVSGHATAWVPKSQSSSWEKVAPANSNTNSTSDRINWESMSSSPIVTRYMGSKNDSFFDISEFKESLETAKTRFGYIIFDECFMSSIETLYPLRNLCDYIVASPCEIMGNGFPYDTTLPNLFTNKGMEFNLQKVCEAYYDYYASDYIPSGCVALTVTCELEALAKISREINTTYSDDQIDIDALQVYERLNGNLFFDFEQYMVAKCTDEQKREEFIDCMAKTFPTECRLHTPRFFANIGVDASDDNNYEAYYTTISYYSGVTTSQPSNRLKTHWATTEWAEATN